VVENGSSFLLRLNPHLPLTPARAVGSRYLWWGIEVEAGRGGENRRSVLRSPSDRLHFYRP
jgi:hypothetical protein